MPRLSILCFSFSLFVYGAWGCDDTRPSETSPNRPSPNEIPDSDNAPLPHLNPEIGLEPDDGVDVDSCSVECGAEAHVTLRFAGEPPIELAYAGASTFYYQNPDCEDVIRATPFGCDPRRFYLQASNVSRASKLAQGGAGGEEAVPSSEYSVDFYLYRNGLSGLYTNPMGESWFLRHAPESLVPESIILSEPGEGISWSGEVIGERISDGAQLRFNVSFAACVAPPSVCVG